MTGQLRRVKPRYTVRQEATRGHKKKPPLAAPVPSHTRIARCTSPQLFTRGAGPRCALRDPAPAPHRRHAYDAAPLPPRTSPTEVLAFWLFLYSALAQAQRHTPSRSAPPPPVPARSGPFGATRYHPARRPATPPLPN